MKGIGGSCGSFREGCRRCQQGVDGSGQPPGPGRSGTRREGVGPGGQGQGGGAKGWGSGGTPPSEKVRSRVRVMTGLGYLLYGTSTRREENVLWYRVYGGGGLGPEFRV